MPFYCQSERKRSVIALAMVFFRSSEILTDRSATLEVVLGCRRAPYSATTSSPPTNALYTYSRLPASISALMMRTRIAPIRIAGSE